jgi:uncharacterized phosphosugar-binding protein
MNTGSGSPVGPVAGVANVANMWAFTAELVAALTRQGKMPTMWQSMYVPGSALRNERIGRSMFEPDITVQPVAPGVLGRQYVDAVGSFLAGIRDSELPLFGDAGARCASAIDAGHKVYAYLIGHFMASQQRMPGYPDMFAMLPHEDVENRLQAALAENDVMLHVGYSYYPESLLRLARERKASTICVMTPGPSVAGEGLPVQPDMSLIDVYIDPFWKHGDSVVEVPGYDTKIIPPSGVVMVTCYWMILGETMAQLSMKSQ